MLPGLAFFYAGLLRPNSVITMMMQNFVAMGVITVLWFLFVFSLCFGHSYYFWGSITTFGAFNNVDGRPLYREPIGEDHDTHKGGTVVSDVPGLVFAAYQGAAAIPTAAIAATHHHHHLRLRHRRHRHPAYLAGMFAVITPALMTGAFADRLRFGPYILFISLWIIFVYAPFCHWIWGGGWMAEWGVWDFAGGIVVHTTAGFSALAAVHVLGSREKIVGAKVDEKPHNIPFVALGTALLWFGWFGFNGGSALASNGSAAVAAVNSEIAASTALSVWVAIEWARNGKPSMVGLCVGAIAGLATITPCAGFVRPWAAFVIGIAAAVFCYGCCELKNRAGWDDALDVWGVHGMGGALGSILVGALADPDLTGGDPGWGGELFGKQVVATLIAAVYSYLVTVLLLKLIGLATRLQFNKEEMENPDKTVHGELAYTSTPGSSVTGGVNFATDKSLEEIKINMNVTPKKGSAEPKNVGA